ncbi:class I SAM-dependent methyltransferase [Nocardioides lentus]|uniref:Class I SAM-dependent methyltransferase n=1 Tax=Nocardioides lentus TaxID=338077 RepID=A0ABN2P740_9ACTN
MSDDLPHRLRDALETADFTHDAVTSLLGVDAHRALERNQTVPARRRTTGGSPLETLTRLFLLQLAVPREQAERALPGLVDELGVAGLLATSVGEVAARTDCRPYAVTDPDGTRTDGWLVSDLTPGMDGRPHHVGTDHVLGVSSASTSLAQLTLRHDVTDALDLGTGCGVQAFHLAGHADRVVATDVNPRALWAARFNADLNDLRGVEVRDGSFFEPVRGERFDLITTNPPFVISPATGERLVYRDSGIPGDRVVEDIVRRAPDHLRPGGWCQVLANWAHLDGVGWDERIAGWLAPGTDALVVQREVLDPAAYVELWLADAGVSGATDGAERDRRYDTWLSWFDEQGITGVGFGWINLRTDGSGRRELLDWPWDVEQPVAPAIAAWGAARVGVGPDDTLRLAADVQQETVGLPGAEDPESVVLRRRTGLRRARRVDTATAAVVGACDGDLRVGQILDAVARILGEDADTLAARLLPELGELAAEGYLL